MFRGAEPARSADVVAAWQSDAAFRDWFNATLARVPFAAFRWETPGLTAATVERAFEFAVVDSPELERAPEPEAFAEQLAATPSGDVLAFPNLGGDAVLVVPRALAAAPVYAHLGAFVRGAPASQRDALWQLVGAALSRRLGAKPVWLSTAGAGVAWLHVRLDDRPKYYAFTPYRACP